uniref:Ring finger protein 122 n=1 Tax=Chelydra serpentina TaxID=8475 RepID=A0A8C3TJM2_CHESE
VNSDPFYYSFISPDLPLNIYMVIFGTGIFVFVLSLIFCCYFISKLRHQAQSERFGYKEVKYSFLPPPLSVSPQQTCAVCLEDFKVKDELGVLPCQHAFHRKPSVQLCLSCPGLERGPAYASDGSWAVRGPTSGPFPSQDGKDAQSSSKQAG